MNKESQQNKMSGLDWFALSTGVIGLGADLITLVSLTQLGSLTTETTTIVWIITPIGILYTTIILSFYARRIAVVRYLEAYGTLSAQMLNVINTGGLICAQVVGTPLLLLYGVSLVISFGDRSNIASNIAALLILGTLGSIILMLIIGHITEIIYAAFDPSYAFTEHKRKAKTVERTTKQDE